MGVSNVPTTAGADWRQAENVAIRRFVRARPSNHVLPDTDGLVCRVGFCGIRPDRDTAHWLVGIGQRCVLSL